MYLEEDLDRQPVDAPTTRPRSPGRPLDPVLTDRLRERAATLLIERGSAGLTANLLAAHTRAGKAGIYRRWPDMRALEAELMERAELLPRPDTDTPPPLAVRALAESWTQPPTRSAQVAAALLGRASLDPTLRRALHGHLHDDLDAWWTGLGGVPAEDATVLHLARALLVAHWVSGPLDREVTATFVHLALRALEDRGRVTGVAADPSR